MQPYSGGNSALWTLTELDNFDKHRLLVVAAVNVGDFWFGSDGRTIRPGSEPAAGSASIKFKPTAAPHAGSKALVFLQDGDELGRFHLSIRRKNHAYAGCSFSVAFRQPKIVEGEAVLPLLHQLTHLVDSIVREFVPFL
jgi:hypothetical protein